MAMRTVILLLSFLAASLPALADSDLTQIRVKVTDEKGKPIDRANVRVAFKQGRRKSTLALTKVKHSWEMKTTQEGNAKIPELPKGDILIQVTANAYQSYGETVTIEEDEKLVEIVLKKPQKQYSSHGENDPTKGAEK